MGSDAKGTVTCLCLETFPKDDRPYVRLTPEKIVDDEGRRVETSMVCCNDCWNQMPTFQRGVLSLLITSAMNGGLRLGSLLAERFWPPFMNSKQVASPQEWEDATRSVPTPQTAVVPETNRPPDQHISEIMRERKERREAQGRKDRGDEE